MILQDLVDIEVFYEAKKVIEALQNKEVAPALAWCSDNKSRLKKSKVPFRLYLMEVFFMQIAVFIYLFIFLSKTHFNKSELIFF